MKRGGRLRHRSQTNSRPSLDADLRAAYLRTYDYDEWAMEIGVTGYLGCRITIRQGRYIDANEVNHIWSLGRRPDVKENLISLTRESHLWFHSHLKEGRVLSVLSKLRKAARRGETFDLAALDKAAGKSVLGVIDNYQFPESDTQMCAWQSETVLRLTELTKGAK